MSEENKAVYRRWVDVLNERSFDMVAEGDQVAVRLTFTGTHRHEFQGISATGRRGETRLMVTYRVADGKITERGEVADGLLTMAQLGATPRLD